VDAKIAEHDRRFAAFESNVSAMGKVDQETLRVHSEALDKAMRDGAPPPDPPSLLLNGADFEVRHGFMAERAALAEERRRAMAQALPDVLQQARPQLKKLVGSAATPLGKLTDAMQATGALLADVKMCRDALNSIDPGQHRHFSDGALTLAEFVRLVSAAGDPLDLVDLPARETEAVPENPVQPNADNRRPGMVVGSTSIARP
jgi:hypothetical protein